MLVCVAIFYPDENLIFIGQQIPGCDVGIKRSREEPRLIFPTAYKIQEQYSICTIEMQ
jgi:hypothetical protein